MEWQLNNSRRNRPLPGCAHNLRPDTRNLPTVEAPVVVFEVISPRNGANDRIIKVREYLAVPSIHAYVIVEQNSIGLTLHRRHDAGG